MRAGVVEREDLLASPHHDERLCACLRLRGLGLRNAVDVERLPFRAATAPRMAIDLAAQIEDELAAEITTHHHEQKAQTGRPLRAAREEWPPAQSRTDRDHIKDERDEHRGRVQAADPFARALEVDVIGVP